MDQGEQRFHGKLVAGVLAAVTDPTGRLLFVKQRKGPFGGHWLLPGGGIEAGEDAVTALVREFWEETGLQIQDPQFVALYELTGEWSGGPYHLLLLGFRATAAGEIPAAFQGDNVDGVRWAAASALPIHSTDMQILNDAGLAQYDPAAIQAALAHDGITMRVYQSVR